jgi:hypothetical protein
MVTAHAAGSTTVEARAIGAGVNGADVVGTASVTATQPVQTLAPVHSVTVTSPRSTIVPGDTMHLTVVLRDAQNNVLTGRPITFASSATSRMTVNTAGVVTGVASRGGADIIATSEGKSGKIQLNSSDGVASMRVQGPSKSVLDLIIPQGGKKRYTVTLEDAAGKPVNNQPVTLSNSNPTVLSLSNSSVVTNGKGEAHVDISASNSLGLATITFSVTRAGAIPPAAAGSNNLTVRLLIAVP